MRSAPSVLFKPTHSIPQANVLIDDLGQVRLTDYGFYPISSTIMFSATGLTTGNTGWLAPEIINQSGAANTIVESKSADIFAFAMLVIEVFTGEPPFGRLGNSAVVIRVSLGFRPVIPPTIEEMGDFLARCWDQDPRLRPEIDEVVQTWGGFLKEDWYVRSI